MDEASWNARVYACAEGSFLQSWQWGEFQRALGTPIWRLNQPAWFALTLARPLPWGWRWLYVPRGPLSTTPMTHEVVSAAHNALITQARREHAVFIRCDPAWPPAAAARLTTHGWIKAPRDVQPAATRVVDLTLAEAELLAQLHPKTRYNIQLAERKGVVVEFSQDEKMLESFLRLAGEVETRAAFRYHSPDYYRTMRRVLAPAGMFEMAQASYQHLVLAVHLLIRGGDTFTYVHGASSSHERQAMAPHLLQWRSLQRAKQAGAKRYDLYGVAPLSATSQHPWAGITRFKEGFGGARHDFMGAYEYVLDPGRYWLYNTGHTLAQWTRQP